MKNIYIIFVLFLSTVFAQISMSDINKLSNQQLDAVKEELQANTKASIVESVPGASNTSSPVSITSTAVGIATGDYFGYNYLRKNISFFDNIPTPADYKLGPGDEIIISLWGENNSRKNMTINKDGMIYYENIGFINLSNKTLESAELVLTEELSRIYSTLKDEANPTTLMLELGKLKSINIYFSGHIENPGINLVHPFSDIFSAIVQAGGVNDKGSLREVQLIRNDTIIAKVDFYSFFMKGENTFSSVKLIDGDIIHVPTVKNRVSISGAVKRPSSYELLNNDTLSDLVNYASGFTSSASSNLILDKIIPVDQRSSDDNAKSSMNIKFKNAKLITLNNGDSVNVLSISNVDSKVEVLGYVKNPGKYSAINSSLKDILDIAGGFNDPIFRKSIRDDSVVVIRKDESQFYGLEFLIPYDKSANFEVNPGDKVFVYEDSKYRNLLSISVEGAVNKRGSFQLRKGMTVGDAIDLAEGFSPLANKNGVVVSEKFSFVDDQGKEITRLNQVNDVSLDFQLTDGSIVNVLPIENVVSVEGNVYNPGLIVHSGSKSVKKYINLAGGPKPNTLSKKIYVKRANGRIKKVSLFRGLGINVNPGDIIFVPVNPDPQDFDITTFIADLASTLANIAAILVIADNQND